jgi:hypothetical protein
MAAAAAAAAEARRDMLSTMTAAAPALPDRRVTENKHSNRYRSTEHEALSG